MIRVHQRYRRITEIIPQEMGSDNQPQSDRVQVRRSKDRVKITATNAASIWGQITTFPKDACEDKDICLLIPRDKWEAAFRKEEIVAMISHTSSGRPSETSTIGSVSDEDFPGDEDVLDHIGPPLSTIYIDTYALRKITEVLDSLGGVSDTAIVRIDTLPVRDGEFQGMRFSMILEGREQAHVCIYLGETPNESFSPFPRGEEPKERTEDKIEIKRMLEV